MCRTTVDGGRRCPSCLDKAKRSAYDRARYANSKIVAQIPQPTSEIEPLVLQENQLSPETISRMNTLAEMPQVDELHQIFDEIQNHDDLMLYFKKRGGELTSVNKDLALMDEAQFDSYETALSAAEKIQAAFDNVIEIPTGEKVKCRTINVVFKKQALNLNMDADGTQTIDLRVVVIGGDIEFDGKPVGQWERMIVLTDKTDPHGYYHMIELDEDAQGFKLGTKLINHFDSVMLAAGITEVRMEANIDVGGYAWAKHGYDWDTNKAPGAGHGPLYDREIQERLEKLAIERGDENNAIKNMVARLDQPYDYNYPIPLEVAMLGKDAPQGNYDFWVGKEALLDSVWDARRRLA